MTDATPQYPGSPVQWTRRVVREGWNDFLSVYYANTPIWRLLKSGALLFLGFFAWSGANLLLSYRADWGFLYYVMAYGFALILWGPLTHLIIVPAVIRLRRTSRGGIRSWLGRNGSKTNLSIFILIVLLLGTFPPGVMTFQFQMPAGGADTADVNPQLQCTRSGEMIHCHLSDSRGIDRVVVTSGQTEITTIEDSPYDFDVSTGDLETVNGDKQFTVELQDENGDTIRRYIRRADLIPG